MRKILFALLVFALMIPGVAFSAGTCWNGGSAGTTPFTVLDGSGGSASGAIVDVEYCVNHVAAAGETVIFSASASWAEPLVITQPVTISFTGATITSSGGNQIFSYTTSAPDNTKLLRITGGTIDGANRAVTAILIANTSTTTALTNIRLDNLTISGCGSTSGMFAITGMVYGLIDNNTLTGSVADRGIFRLSGAGNTSWDLTTFPLQPGTANMLYIEDNTISGSASGWYITQGNDGTRWVFRNNTVDLANSGGPALDSHGNQSSDTSNVPTSCALASNERGTVGNEVYDNTFTNHNGNIILRDVRGGTNFIYSNTDAGSVNGGIQVREEDANTTGGCYLPLVASYPGWDPITNSYFWSNTHGGSAMKIVEGSGNGTDDDYITEQVDYWTDTQPATPWAARTYFTKDVAVNRNLTTCTDEDVYWATDTKILYRCNPTNTWAVVYAPYSYPHPMQGGTTTRTITSSKVGAVGTLSYEGESIVNDGDNSQIYTASNIPNGWKHTWSGTCGATGSGVTYQKTNVTEDCTVIATFTEIKLMPW